eukprot:TRINITY_DN10845_c0_g1_i1.p1 TRINITY_DN10845_c0_g1~~TRINITY_DN10845_c0_g1_i1.p1  ORF type:complete len:337 (+),score=98.25 TRINITY_DN10845_c0_g1_i1:95-1105(+)
MQRASSRLLSRGLYGRGKKISSVNMAGAFSSNQQQQRNYPAGGKAKALKTRIDTIGSIVKVTASMKMIANAKLQKQQDRLRVARRWRDSVLSLLEFEYPALDTKDEFYIDKKQAQEAEEVENQELIVAISSDRGLCGGVNSQIGKDIVRLMKIKSKANILFIGEKPIQQLSREYSRNFSMTVSQVSGNKPITFHECAELADRILEMPYDKYTFIYNTFASILSFVVTGVRYPSKSQFLEVETRHAPFLITDYQNVLKSAYEHSIAGLLFSVLTEAQTCEIAARMTAMENATTNGKDLIKTLTLQYNKQRQSAITTELVEIVSGAAAVDEQRKKSED